MSGRMKRKSEEVEGHANVPPTPAGAIMPPDACAWRLTTLTQRSRSSAELAQNENTRSSVQMWNSNSVGPASFGSVDTMLTLWIVRRWILPCASRASAPRMTVTSGGARFAAQVRADQGGLRGARDGRAVARDLSLIHI